MNKLYTVNQKPGPIKQAFSAEERLGVYNKMMASKFGPELLYIITAINTGQKERDIKNDAVKQTGVLFHMLNDLDWDTVEDLAAFYD